MQTRRSAGQRHFMCLDWRLFLLLQPSFMHLAYFPDHPLYINEQADCSLSRLEWFEVLGSLLTWDWSLASSRLKCRHWDPFGRGAPPCHTTARECSCAATATMGPGILITWVWMPAQHAPLACRVNMFSCNFFGHASCWNRKSLLSHSEQQGDILFFFG